MINEILPSDVEFATGMMDANHSDAEILAFLASRGIEPTKAAQLLDDLHHGRKPNIELPFVLGVSGSPVARPPRTAGAEEAQSPDSPPRHPHRGRHQRAGVPWWFIILVLIFVLALGYAFIEMGDHVSSDIIDKDRHDLPPPPGK